VSRKINPRKNRIQDREESSSSFQCKPGKKEDTDDSNHAFLVKKLGYWLQEERPLKGKFAISAGF